MGKRNKEELILIQRKTRKELFVTYEWSSDSRARHHTVFIYPAHVSIVRLLHSSIVSNILSQRQIAINMHAVDLKGAVLVDDTLSLLRELLDRGL